MSIPWIHVSNIGIGTILQTVFKVTITVTISTKTARSATIVATRVDDFTSKYTIGKI